MINVYKSALMSFVPPIISCLIFWHVPDSYRVFNYISMIIIAGLFLSYIIMLLIFGKRKRKNAARLIASYNLIAFCLFFTFPLMKIYTGYLVIQLILAAIFIISIILAVIDQNKEVPLVFPGDNKEHRKFANFYYLFPAFLALLAGGGNFLIIRELHLTLGDKFMTIWLGIIVYILGCWMAFLIYSMVYKAHVKEGLLIK